MNRMWWYLLGWRRIAKVSGRSGRREYWTFVLVNTLVVVCFLLAAAVLVGNSVDVQKFRYTADFCYLAAFLSTFTCLVRRLHDTNKSGVWFLLVFIPLGAFVILYFLLRDSDPGPNQYGDHPKLLEAVYSPHQERHVNPLDELQHTLDVLGKAIRAKDTDKAFEAVTIFLMEFTGLFGPDSSIFAKTIPFLERLKEHIEKEQFEDAQILTDALLVSIRQGKAIRR